MYGALGKSERCIHGLGGSEGMNLCNKGMLLRTDQNAHAICAIGSKLPVFPYNRGWETQPNSRGLYTHYKGSVIKGGMTIPDIATFDHATYTD